MVSIEGFYPPTKVRLAECCQRFTGTRPRPSLPLNGGQRDGRNARATHISNPQAYHSVATVEPLVEMGSLFHVHRSLPRTQTAYNLRGQLKAVRQPWAAAGTMTHPTRHGLRRLRADDDGAADVAAQVAARFHRAPTVG